MVTADILPGTTGSSLSDIGTKQNPTSLTGFLWGRKNTNWRTVSDFWTDNRQKGVKGATAFMAFHVQNKQGSSSSDKTRSWESQDLKTCQSPAEQWGLWLVIRTYSCSSFALNDNVFSLGVYLQGTTAENWLHGNKQNWGNATKLTETDTWIPQWIHISTIYTHCMFSPATHTRECDCWQESGKWTVNNKLK